MLSTTTFHKGKVSVKLFSECSYRSVVYRVNYINKNKYWAHDKIITTISYWNFTGLPASVFYEMQISPLILVELTVYCRLNLVTWWCRWDTCHQLHGSLSWLLKLVTCVLWMTHALPQVYFHCAIRYILMMDIFLGFILWSSRDSSDSIQFRPEAGRPRNCSAVLETR
jgi:hypothetical protein